MEKQELNGWQNIGKVSIWVLDKLQGSELHVYLMIVRSTIGYSQYTSDFLPQTKLAKLTGLSVRSVERVLPKLISKGYIIQVGTNHEVTFKGKLPYKYQLNMKLPNFPSLGNLKQGRDDVTPTKQPWDERVQLYFIDSTDSILPLYIGNSPDNRRSPEWFNHTFSTNLSEVVYPTTEQLLIYLKEQS